MSEISILPFFPTIQLTVNNSNFLKPASICLEKHSRMKFILLKGRIAEWALL